MRHKNAVVKKQIVKKQTIADKAAHKLALVDALQRAMWQEQYARKAHVEATAEFSEAQRRLSEAQTRLLDVLGKR